MEKNLRSALFVFIIIIFVANLAGSFGLYWTWAWFDIPMHVLGGAWIALLGAYILGVRTKIVQFQELTPLARFIFILGFVAIVGIGWEIFEYLVDALFVSKSLILARPGDLFDSLKDLFDDLVGAGAMCVVLHYALWKRDGKE